MHSSGGKASGLIRLKEEGFEVPDFIVLPLTTPIEEVHADVARTLQPEDLLVVRSSAAQEDGSSKSYAGQFHSEVAVSVDQLPGAWERVVSSMPNEEGDAVIIQQFIAGDFSGVCFVDAENERLMMDYLPGLCTAVVGGQDVHHLSFKEEALLGQRNCEQPMATTWADGAFTEALNSSQMSDNEINAVRDTVYRVSKAFGQPLDIEWTIKSGHLYLLQARPITQTVWDESKVRFYDSANVGESYGGLVLPLTISFAQRLYSQVYQDLLFHSGVPRNYLKCFQHVFDQLVDGAFGRMYYRMEHWYAFLSMLPGYSRNKKNLEHMLLLQDHGNNNQPIRPLWHVALLYYPRVLWKLFRFKSSMKQLEADTKLVLETASGWNYGVMNAKDAQVRLEGLFEGILRQWYLTVENDTVVLSLYASLSKQSEVKANDPMLDFHSVSTEQVMQLEALAKLLNAHPEVRSALDENSAEKFFAVMEGSPELNRAYSDYFRRFGGRFANELKLETPGLKGDPEGFIRLIKLYAQRPESAVKQASKQEKTSFLVRVFRRFASRREVFRLYRAELFSVVRRLVLVIASEAEGKGELEKKEDVFYLHWDEMLALIEGSSYQAEVEERKTAYRYFKQIEPPAHFKVQQGRWPQPTPRQSTNKPLTGFSACKGKAMGRALVLPNFEVPDMSEIGILVTKRTDPGWTPLMALSKGLVVEHGGMLSHASIVARELGIPTVIGVEGACDRIKNGDMLTVDGDAGIVLKIDEDGSE